MKINYCESSEMENLFLISSLHPLSTFLENVILSSPLWKIVDVLLSDKFLPIKQHILSLRACIVIE